MSKVLINITHRQAIIFAVFLVLYEFLTYIANDMIMPGMLSVVEYFHAPDSDVATSLTMYMLGGASLQIFLGPLSDSLGRRPVMLWGACLFFVFTLFIVFSFSMQSFLVARFFQGTGLCFISVVGYAVLQEILAEKEAIKLIAIMSNIAILAPLIGPLAGVAFLYYSGDWRSIFLLLAGFAIFAWWGLWRYMPESVRAVKLDGEIIQPMTLSRIAIKQSYKALLFNKNFIIGNLAYGLLSIPCIIWIALSPNMIVNDAHASLLVYGLWQIPVFGAYILGNFTLLRLINRLPLLRCALIGSVFVISGVILMFAISIFYPNQFLAFMPGLIIYFFGLSVVGAPLNRMLLYVTPTAKGTTSALISVFSMCAQAVGIEIINYFYTAGNYLIFSLYSMLIGLFYMIFLIIFSSKTNLEIS